MSTIGIRKKKIEIGVKLEFPFVLSESQVTKIIEYYEKEDWKCTKKENIIILRKESYKIQLSGNYAIIAGEGDEIEKIQTSTEKIYRKTLDRSFVFLLVSEQRIKSSILNISRGNYRAAVTDIYYATYSAIRAISFFLGDEELAKKFEHPGLQNPADVDTLNKAEWNFEKRTEWLETINKALIEVRKKQKNENLEELEKRIKYISKWIGKNLKIEYRSDNYQGKYKDLMKTTDKDAFYLENAIANCLYWLRIRADYRVDFESLVASKDITNALYIGVCFVNIANYLIYDTLRFDKIITDKNSFYSPDVIKGRIIDFGFDRSKLTKKLFLISECFVNSKEDDPEGHFEIKPIDVDMKLPEGVKITKTTHIMSDKGSFKEIVYITKSGKRARRRRKISRFQFPMSIEEQKSEFTVKKDGYFEIRAKDRYFANLSLDVIKSKCNETYPKSFIIIQTN